MLGGVQLAPLGGGYPHDEVDEASSQVPLGVDQVLEVLHGATFSGVRLEVPQVVFVFGVGVAGVLGGVNSHPPELLEPAQDGVEGAGLVGFVFRKGCGITFR